MKRLIQPTYVRAEELRQIFGQVTKRTISNWYHKGYFKKYLIGGVAMYDVEEVRNALTVLQSHNSKTSSTNNKKSGS
jgi:hypothetical protein